MADMSDVELIRMYNENAKTCDELKEFFNERNIRPTQALNILPMFVAAVIVINRLDQDKFIKMTKSMIAIHQSRINN